MKDILVIKLGALGDCFRTYCMLANNVSPSVSVLFLTNPTISKYVPPRENIRIKGLRIMSSNISIIYKIKELFILVRLITRFKYVFLLHPSKFFVKVFSFFAWQAFKTRLYSLTRSTPSQFESYISNQVHWLMPEIILLNKLNNTLSNTIINYSLHSKSAINLSTRKSINQGKSKFKIVIFPSTGNYIQKTSNRDISPDSLFQLTSRLTQISGNVHITAVARSKIYHNQFIELINSNDFTNDQFTNHLLGLTEEGLLNIIQSSDLIICVDSFPMYLSLSYSKNIIIISGPTNPSHFVDNLRQSNLKIFSPEENTCRHCYSTSDGGNSPMYKCSNPTCMSERDYSLIAQEAMKILSNN